MILVAVIAALGAVCVVVTALLLFVYRRWTKRHDRRVEPAAAPMTFDNPVYVLKKDDSDGYSSHHSGGEAYEDNVKINPLYDEVHLAGHDMIPAHEDGDGYVVTARPAGELHSDPQTDGYLDCQPTNPGGEFYSAFADARTGSSKEGVE